MITTSKSHIGSNLLLRNSLTGVDESMVAYFPFRYSPNDSLYGIEPSVNSNTTLTENGIAVEEATTNLCSGLGGNEYNLSKFYSTDGSRCEIVTIGNKRWVKYKDSSSASLRIASIQIESNTTYTWSFLAYADVNDDISLVQWDGGSYGTKVYSLTATVKKITHTFTSRASSTNEILHITGLLANTNFYFADFQLEKKAFATSFVSGSRPSEGKINIPFSLSPPYTISLFHKPSKPLSQVADQASSPMIFQMGGYYTNASISFWNYVKELRVYIKGDSSGGWTSTSTHYSYNNDTWDDTLHWYSLVAIDNTTFNTYMDGIKMGSQVSTDSVTKISFIDIGNARNPNATYKHLSIYNRALSDEEIYQLYLNSGSFYDPNEDVIML